MDDRGSAPGAPHPFDAVIFDMDGVLIDSEWCYYLQLKEYAQELGIEVSEEELRGQVGQSFQSFCDLMIDWQARAGHPGMGVDEVMERYADWVEAHPIDYAAILNPGAGETLRELSRRGVRRALASSSPMVNIEAVLCACDLRDAFEVIVSGEQFQESKPTPEIYLHTLDRLGLPAARCCCVEDSVPGIAAGKAAGLFTIAKREERFGFSQEAADLIIDELPDLLTLA